MSNITWCQNPKCPEKKNSNQIRGVKGKKYYQSNKASQWLEYWCTNSCREEWWREHRDTCLRAVGLRTEPVKVNMENAWLIESDYQSSSDYGESHWLYFLVNKLNNVRHHITKQQASIHPNDEYSPRLSSAQAGVLAKQLGLTNQ